MGRILKTLNDAFTSPFLFSVFSRTLTNIQKKTHAKKNRRYKSSKYDIHVIRDSHNVSVWSLSRPPSKQDKSPARKKRRGRKFHLISFVDSLELHLSIYHSFLLLLFVVHDYEIQISIWINQQSFRHYYFNFLSVEVINRLHHINKNKMKQNKNKNHRIWIANPAVMASTIFNMQI